MHFSFPFTAGEYPEARYGHATCNYTLLGEEKQNLILLGGINHGFCTMDIYTLVELERSENMEWEKIIQKDAYEEKAHNSASKYVYQARKHCQDLYDIILLEKTETMQVKEDYLAVKERHNKAELECKQLIDEKEKEMEMIDKENQALEETMEDLMTLMQFEEYNCEILDEKTECLQEYFQSMQDYMATGDMLFTLIRKSKQFIF